MSLLLQVSSVLMVALGAVEGLSYVWTHPQQEPHLRVKMAHLPSSGNFNPTAGETMVALPDVYEKSAPMLRCSSGEVFFKETGDGIGLNLAFFEWRGTDTGSVLEAFRHMPEVCLGSVGMKLVATEPPVRYQAGGKTLIFDHTVFQDPGQGGGFSNALVHSFRGIWVAGIEQANARDGIDGDSISRLRDIRLKSAAKRFRPPYACVIQGAVRGAITGEAAWQAFENSMLEGMKFR